MRHSRIETIVICLGMIILSPSFTSAQTRTVLHMGDRVRIHSVDASGNYILISKQCDVLTLKDEDGFLVSGIKIGDVTNLQLAVPRPSGKGARRGASIGFFTGVGVGAIYGVIEGGDPPCSGGELCFSLSTQGKATLYGVLFGILGGIIGGFVGTSHPGTEWQDIDISEGFDVILIENNERILVLSINI